MVQDNITTLLGNRGDNPSSGFVAGVLSGILGRNVPITQAKPNSYRIGKDGIPWVKDTDPDECEGGLI